MLYLGLHPERGNLAVKNEVFQRGDNMWGFWWLDVEYPDFDEKLRREYTFSFDVINQAFILSCKGEVSSHVKILASSLNQFFQFVVLIDKRSIVGEVS